MEIGRQTLKGVDEKKRNSTLLEPARRAPLCEMRTLCRHCASLAFDRVSYSSVLVTGGTDGVQTTIADLEARIVPCITAVCPVCERVSVLSDGSLESLLCTVYMWQRLRDWRDK